MTNPYRWLAVLLLSFTGPASAATLRVRPVPLLTPGVAPLGSAAAVTRTAGSFGTPFSAAPSLPEASLPSLALPGLSGLRPAGVLGALRKGLPSLTGTPALAPSAIPTAPVLSGAAGAIAAAAPAAITPGADPAHSANMAALARNLSKVQAAQDADLSGVQAGVKLDALYSGSPALSVVEAGAFAVNNEGIVLLGRAADYYRKIRWLVDLYAGRLDLSESLDVMADSYGDVWAKVKAMEAVGGGSKQTNTHLEQTLTWVDGFATIDGRTTAIHTHRVFFHRAKNPKSEIAEGIRRVDRYLRETLHQFAQGGKAEAELGRFQDVLLVFDTRGYAEIKSFLRGREAQLKKAGLTRYRIAFLDEMTKMPATDAEMRSDLNAMSKKYRGRELRKIIEGVTYSRYVGLLLELATVDHFMGQGWDILQSGRELFDAEGMYITELDAVARSPEGKVALVEAKSARVPLPFAEVLKDKVAAKLEAYAKNRALLESSIGGRIDEVVFSFDVGANRGLQAYLQAREKELAAKYGFPVRFLFLKMDEAGDGGSPASGRAHQGRGNSRAR